MPELPMFIKEVVFRLDFKQSPNLTKDFLDKIRETLKGEFPDTENQSIVTLELGVQQAERVLREKTSPVVVLLNKKTNNRMIFEPNALSFDIASYENYTKFREIVNVVISSMLAYNPSIQVSRAGLRYINQISLPDGSPFDWSNKIAEELRCGLGFPELRSNLLKAMGVWEFDQDDCRIRFQYGMFNSEYPNRISKKEFALDYDCYCTEEGPLTSVLLNMDRFHKTIKGLFDRSIGDELSKKEGE